MSKAPKSHFPLAELIKSLAPITLMGKAMCVGIVVWFIDWVFVEGKLLFGSRLLKEIVDVASFLALIPLTWFLIKGAHWVGENLLWRLRRRLIVTYLLIGALPLLLVLLLVTLVLLAIVGQSSVSLVGRQLDGYLEQSQAAAQSLSGDLNRLDAESLRAGPKAEQLRRQLQESADSLSPIFPDLMLSVRRDDAEAFSVTVRGRSSENDANRGDSVNVGDRPLAGDSPLPQWLSQRVRAGQEFHGLVVEADAANQRRIYARHIIKLKQPAALIFQLSYPIGENLCAHLSHTTDLEVKPATASFPLVMTANGPQPDIDKLENAGGLEGGGLMVFKLITEWRTGEKIENEALKVDPSFILPSRLYQRVEQFKSGSVFGSAVVAGVGLSIAFFLLIALLAVISAIFLTRSITGAVHHLYEGTKRVETGDFDHEIPITGRDQLGDLSKSFNQMTVSIRELLRVSAEKQRLDQEMRIAAAVQARLFPRSIPKSEKLEIAKGVCIPARAVSGDYYDLLGVAPGVIGIVVADVCGKGVSAALMMANLQANLRGQALAYRDAYDYKMSLAAQSEYAGEQSTFDGGFRRRLVKRIVERVNQQVAESVMDASYITFFYAEFDEQHSALRYTNAGHNPPLLVRSARMGAERVERLDRGGTVLGLFCDVEYEEGELQLESGDALVAFTDGLVEARNPSGEEFGEERLIRTLLECARLSAAQIEDRILRTVEDWTAEAEQEDDLTLIILKVK
ncbi:MAG: SpoIIE family protein phosphatase [Acidobacteria bacterium]|nr:SpoIIE family protein phosphatase [Acidobacteriota bacterium]